MKILIGAVLGCLLLGVIWRSRYREPGPRHYRAMGTDDSDDRGDGGVRGIEYYQIGDY